MMTKHVDPRLLAQILVVAGLVFAASLLVEPAVAMPLAYVGVVLLALPSAWPPLALWLAALATVLTVVAGLLVAEPFSTADLINRGLALAVVWPVAFMCSSWLRASRQLKGARLRIEQQKDHAETSAIQAETALRSEQKDRVRIAEELEETEHRYRAVFNQTFQLTAVLNPLGAIEELNETMRGIGLLQSETFVGTPIWDLPVWDAAGRERLRHAVAAAAFGDFFRDELHIRRPEEDDMVVDLSLKPIRSPTGLVDLVVLEARDITQHKRDQSLLMQTQKMEVLGQFASGIAHDFNNLLTVIAGNLELVERRVQDDKAITQRIVKAVNAVFRGQTLTDRILAFARQKQLEPRSVDIKALIAEAIDLARSGLDDITMTQHEIAPDLWPCWVDPAQLQTALLNLLINARDAMPDGGPITVRASNFTLELGRRENGPDLPEGDYVVVSVSDEGVGIPADLLDRVTDPFFTTKEVGSGSGLGLSMVAGFTAQSGGDLTIRSKEGRGTSVSLYLPRSRETLPLSLRQLQTTVSRSEGRILVVEDDPDVRDAAVSMLSELGYKVEEASDGASALTVLRRNGRFDLMLTDLVMPGDLDGAALGRQARTLLPDLKILYASGNPERAEEVGPTDEAREDFIAKPYRFAELAQKTESLLTAE